METKALIAEAEALLVQAGRNLALARQALGEGPEPEAWRAGLTYYMTTTSDGEYYAMQAMDELADVLLAEYPDTPENVARAIRTIAGQKKGDAWIYLKGWTSESLAYVLESLLAGRPILAYGYRWEPRLFGEKAKADLAKVLDIQL